MKLKLKDFSQFFEEADIKKNIGLPKDFTSKAEEEATRNLGINIDQPTQSRLIEYANKADQLMARSIPKDNIEEKYLDEAGVLFCDEANLPKPEQLQNAGRLKVIGCFGRVGYSACAGV